MFLIVRDLLSINEIYIDYKLRTKLVTSTSSIQHTFNIHVCAIYTDQLGTYFWVKITKYT